MINGGEHWDPYAIGYFRADTRSKAAYMAFQADPSKEGTETLLDFMQYCKVLRCPALDNHKGISIEVNDMTDESEVLLKSMRLMRETGLTDDPDDEDYYYCTYKPMDIRNEAEKNTAQAD